jgi:hypothetical protein
MVEPARDRRKPWFERRRARLLVAVTTLSLAGGWGCGPGEHARSDRAPQDSVAGPGRGAGGRNEFDPATLRVGDRILGLRVAAADIALALDSTYVGDVRFAGRVRVRGTPIWHFDHPEVDLLCFEVDSSSVDSLPRWPRDERRVWFCFDNREEAVRTLGPPRDRRRVRIEIEDYQTVRHPTDAFDTARLIRVIEEE